MGGAGGARAARVTALRPCLMLLSNHAGLAEKLLLNPASILQKERLRNTEDKYAVIITCTGSLSSINC